MFIEFDKEFREGRIQAELSHDTSRDLIPDSLWNKNVYDPILFGMKGEFKRNSLTTRIEK